ncbi:MAG: hypothetical protein GKR86_00175 [Ilumatobacter sp.]|nr:hypothetical protein [Ilumatobacter sp.]
MIHVFKAGGDWVVDNLKYHVIAINESQLPEYLADGWATDIKKVMNPKKGAAYYRGEIKKLGARPASNASVEALKKQLRELKENGSTTQGADR